MGMEASFADLGWGSVHRGRVGVHGRCRRECDRPGCGVGEGAMALSVRVVGVFVANVVCGGREAVCGHRRGVGALYVWAALRRARAGSKRKYGRNPLWVCTLLNSAAKLSHFSEN